SGARPQVCGGHRERDLLGPRGGRGGGRLFGPGVGRGGGARGGGRPGFLRGWVGPGGRGRFCAVWEGFRGGFRGHHGGAGGQRGDRRGPGGGVVSPLGRRGRGGQREPRRQCVRDGDAGGVVRPLVRGGHREGDVLPHRRSRVVHRLLDSDVGRGGGVQRRDRRVVAGVRIRLVAAGLGGDVRDRAPLRDQGRDGGRH